MHLTKEEIHDLDFLKRINIVNSITGIKPANLIGTISDGKPNLAIFSSIVHLGSNPALIGFIARPDKGVRRHTLENIRENDVYTINHIHQSFTEKAHYTSAKFKEGVSEFEKCGLSEEYLQEFKAPFVKESKLKIGMRFVEEISIKLNNTIMVIGEVVHLFVSDDAVLLDSQIDLSVLGSVGISGLNSYYSLNKIAEYPYARPDELPEF